MTRAFLALDLPDAACARLTAVARRAQLPPTARLLPAEALHLTLLFLGDQSDATLHDLHHALARLPMPVLHLQLTGLGSFTSQTLHADVAPDPTLAALEGAMRRAALKAGITLARRRFHPHVTIARFPAGTISPAALADTIARLGPPDPTPIPVTGFSLLESQLSPGGARYTRLASYPP
jgi:2'-5' RNA ligase